MAYFGKEFKFEREENYEDFIKALETSEATANKFLNFKPNVKLTKNGDEYTMTLTNGDFKKDIVFKPGVPFTETMSNGLTPTSVFTVDGDTFYQVQTFGDKGAVSYERQFSSDKLVVNIKSSNWDGVATRYYVPV